MSNNYCNKCGECCQNIRADLKNKILYWDGIKTLPEDFARMLVKKESSKDIYTCKYLKDKKCTNPQKPELCTNYPSSPFIELNDSCGYSGFIFIQAEKIKQKIRKLKEEIIHYTAIIETTTGKKEHDQLQRIIDSHQKHINKYKEYGSQDW